MPPGAWPFSRRELRPEYITWSDVISHVVHHVMPSYHVVSILHIMWYLYVSRDAYVLRGGTSTSFDAFASRDVFLPCRSRGVCDTPRDVIVSRFRSFKIFRSFSKTFALKMAAVFISSLDILWRFSEFVLTEIIEESGTEDIRNEVANYRTLGKQVTHTYSFMNRNLLVTTIMVWSINAFYLRELNKLVLAWFHCNYHKHRTPYIGHSPL